MAHVYACDKHSNLFYKIVNFVGLTCNNRLGQKCLLVANTLAYPAKKSFITFAAAFTLTASFAVKLERATFNRYVISAAILLISNIDF